MKVGQRFAWTERRLRPVAVRREVERWLRVAAIEGGASVVVSLAALAIFASPVAAADLSSAGFQHRAGQFVAASAAGARALVSTAPVPRFGAAATSVGAAPGVAPGGRPSSLASLLPGFWAIVAGVFPSLDLDGDLAAWFLDADDDGDGLIDAVESSSGLFVSILSTGTNPFDPDSDGDGFLDGHEIGLGSDPNDPLSLPALPAVPGLGGSALAVLGLSLLLMAAPAIGARARNSS